MTRPTLTRRGFVAGSAAFAGLHGLRSVAALADSNYDLIVVGAGTAGIPTALFASQKGARVLLIDKASMIGGTLFWSTAQIAGADTVFQRRLGIEDSPAAHYEDCMRINHHTADAALTRLTVDHAGSMINWLAAHGFTVKEGHPVTGIGHDHFKVRRYVQGVDSGLSILNIFKPQLDAQIAAGRVTLLLDTEVVELMQDPRDQAITGVLARGPDGAMRDLRARSTVLSTGGCASNPRLFEDLHGVPLYAQAAYPTSTGQGLLLGLSVGGVLRGGDKYASLPGFVLREHRYPSTMHAYAPLHPGIRMPWEVLVNVHGERFVQEDNPSVNHIEHGIAAQPGHRHWAVYDQAMLMQSPPIIPDWSVDRLAREHDSHPMFHRADTLESLAYQAGVNPRNLALTVAAYNANIMRGDADSFGRTHRPLAIKKPPFYAIEMQGWTLVSFAGLHVNPQLQVLNADRRPIRGLYALGEVLGAGATSGRAYTNGMLVTPAITFGRWLGERLAVEVA